MCGCNKDAPCECEERLLDSLVHLGGCLHEPNAQLFGKLSTLLLRHCSLVSPVGLVANEDLVYAFRRMLLDVGVPGTDVFIRP